MAISTDVLRILRCPDSGQGLRLATEAEHQEILARIKAKELSNRSGETFDGALDGSLVREDGRVFFPIVDGIPNLIFADAYFSSSQ